MIKVSVVVPVYNAENTIQRCIDSITAQTLQDIEIILVDDGSSDETARILDSYSTMDNILVFHLPHSGVSSCRNYGIEKASGEFIGFVDADDYIEKTMYEKMYSSAVANKVDAAVCRYCQEDVFNNVKNLSKKYVSSDVVIDSNTIKQIAIEQGKQPFFWFTWKCIYRRELLLDHQIRYIDHILGEDTVFNLDAFLSADSLFQIDAPLYHYVGNPESTMRKKHKDNFVNLLDEYYQRKIEVYEKHHLIDYEETIREYALNHSSLMLLRNELHYKRTTVEKMRAYREIRNCRMMKDAFSLRKKTNISSIRMWVLLSLLKYRMYFALYLIDRITTPKA